MATKKKATASVRIYPSTHKRLKLNAAQAGMSMAKYIESTV
jgi:predicted HicB family RNase H-like nuclease